MQLSGKAVLITGAASGLGAATALACARAGASLFLVDIDEAGLEAIAGELAPLGGRCEIHAADIGDREACFEAVAAAVARLGRLDGLCNVAGMLRFHRVTEVTAEDWSRILAVNLSAPFHLSQAAIPELIRTHGSIVNVASSGGIVGTAYTAPYSTTKAALIHMTRCMAMEYVHEPIRINAVAPGAMATNIGRGLAMPDGLDPSLIARYSGLRPAADPIEVANLIVYMLSDATPSMHGAVVSADGGVTAG